METGTLRIGINERESVTALLYPAAKPLRASVTIVLGHGAGADQLSSFMRMMGEGLAARGFDVMTFNFLYKEQGRGIPDPKARLELCYQAVIKTALQHPQLKKNRLIIGGKSMGGRIASQVAAVAPEGIAGLVFLGYPLHPPGRPEKMRDQHLPAVAAPMLFVQGGRDTFGSAAEIHTVIKKRHLNAKVYVIDGGDHSFKVPKSLGVPQQTIYETVMDQVAEWARGPFNLNVVE